MSAPPRAQEKGTQEKRSQAGASGGKTAKKKGKKSAPLLVTLEHARWRHFGWAAFCMILGGLLLLKLGAVGQVIGLGLIALATYRGYRFAKTLLLPAGTIEVTSTHVELPLGLCHGKTDRKDIEEVSHVFMLRRAVPWTSSGPLLVIEVAERSYLYPRDWFESESDQRLIMQAINTHGKKSASD